ncbi:hypothetical protein [Methylobacterium sp. Leaf111]|uniref:hypothetical protein n=1 Tax=Methylobacterium sp. Leaf111 TaxID=1736257 RepID=UPI001FCD8D4F|nr:hypothetical protein [Methylobacterium sp. Leaf111]
MGPEQPSPQAVSFGPLTDPMPRLFAAFQALLERHEAALADCDRIETALLAQMDYPRVSLRPDWDGSRRYAADALSIAQEGLPGRHRRRLERVLQRRQRRWDAAAHAAGLTAAQAHEVELDGAVLDTADRLLATPAWTLDAVMLKLFVLLSTREPGPHAGATTRWRELRLILMDLQGLATNSASHP